MEAQNTSGLVSRLEEAAVASSLDAPAVNPWHLKMAFTLYDSQGKNPMDGDLEEWWAGPDQNSVVSRISPARS